MLGVRPVDVAQSVNTLLLYNCLFLFLSAGMRVFIKYGRCRCRYELQILNIMTNYVLK